MSIDFERLVAVLAFFVIICFIGACTYTINVPSDITCSDMKQLNSNKYSLLECTNTTSDGPYNIILSIQHKEQ